MADNVRDRDRLISRDLEEKTILLREVHHRVKNNLQIMSSLLHLEERYIRDPADAELLRSSQNRVFSMSLTHEILYQSESLSGIRVSDYAKSLVLNDMGSASSRCAIGDRACRLARKTSGEALSASR